jgi:hypothetical protein
MRPCVQRPSLGLLPDWQETNLSFPSPSKLHSIGKRISMNRRRQTPANKIGGKALIFSLGSDPAEKRSPSFGATMASALYYSGFYTTPDFEHYSAQHFVPLVLNTVLQPWRLA